MGPIAIASRLSYRFRYTSGNELPLIVVPIRLKGGKPGQISSPKLSREGASARPHQLQPQSLKSFLLGPLHGHGADL